MMRQKWYFLTFSVTSKPKGLTIINYSLNRLKVLFYMGNVFPSTFSTGQQVGLSTQ